MSNPCPTQGLQGRAWNNPLHSHNLEGQMTGQQLNNHQHSTRPTKREQDTFPIELSFCLHTFSVVCASIMQDVCFVLLKFLVHGSISLTTNDR